MISARRAIYEVILVPDFYRNSATLPKQKRYIGSPAEHPPLGRLGDTRDPPPCVAMRWPPYTEATAVLLCTVLVQRVFNRGRELLSAVCVRL